MGYLIALFVVLYFLEYLITKTPAVFDCRLSCDRLSRI